MKKILNKIYGVLLILSLAFLFANCAGTAQLPEVVCETGNVICETGNLICEFPQLPEEVCYYLNLACINLQYLCEYEWGTPEYLRARSDLRKINKELTKLLNAERLKQREYNERN